MVYVLFVGIAFIWKYLFPVIYSAALLAVAMCVMHESRTRDFITGQ